MSQARDHIRNFCIIAHIDHGKSTLADRLLEATGAVEGRDMKEQVLDQLDLERERGITIKLAPVKLNYKAKNGETYELNLIDTPGHVDFSYEVSRSLAACEGAILVVDAAQGVEAQTLANVYAAINHDLEIIPVINKIDLPAAEPELVRREIEEVIGLPGDEAILASAREGIGIEEILEAVVERIPPPQGDAHAPLQALIFDSSFDTYRGVISYVRVVAGRLAAGKKVKYAAAGKIYEVDEVGTFRPAMQATKELVAGEVGYVIAAIKDLRDARVGDTIVDAAHPAPPLPGYRPALPMVYAGIYPQDSDDFQDLKEALEKLQLNDSAVVYEPESSAALGFGFRIGFLGLLHMEIVQERLEREFNLDLIATAPTVVYRVTFSDGRVEMIDNPEHFPPPHHAQTVEEPRAKISLITPSEYTGAMMQLCQDRRGDFINLEHHPGERVELHYDMPMAELIHDFYDQLKSRSKGYASLDYELTGYREADLVKLDVLVGGSRVDALSMIVPRNRASIQGRKLVEKLKDLIPRQMFEVAIQAAIGGKIVARETVSAFRKDVIAKCYGGDVTRKRKLLEKQKAGKQRLKRVGNVEIPQEAFMAVLSLES
ncbi:MAG TPA: translation elongation factor 4 [Candidatus Dormibacteraeota bacterium]|jgi:GTP-binding protein LepA|nr:translation elongation factor 4 [Candidatus Dormibacteraeota bacterium]